MLDNQIVINKAKEIGFDLIGFAKAQELKDEIQNLEIWLSKNFQAGMAYMEKNIEKRRDVKNIFPNAKSVISLAKNYFINEEYSEKPDTGKVSRYAWGVDYHFVLWDKLDQLIKSLKEIDPEFDAIYYVDTGPVMDKVWAKKAGLGWIGKHTNLISKEFGSWIFLANIITNYDFNFSEQVEDFCGTCTRCIDACPTNAIAQEYVVDANKCISYLTIENKGEIADEFKGKFENWIFGCDICQEVCPWNIKFKKETGEPKFKLENKNKEFKISEILQMENPDFKKIFEFSPIKRSKLKGLKRNAEFLKK